jgi:hypothetical protein
VQSRNRRTTRFDAKKWENSMQETPNTGHHHLRAEPKRGPHMLEVSFTNGGGVFCKSFHNEPLFEETMAVMARNHYGNSEKFLLYTKNIGLYAEISNNIIEYTCAWINALQRGQTFRRSSSTEGEFSL